MGYYPIGALVNNLDISHHEDLRPWNNHFMLRSGANIFVSQIPVQGRCDIQLYIYGLFGPCFFSLELSTLCFSFLLV